MSYANIKRKKLINRSKQGPKVKGLKLSKVKPLFKDKAPKGDTSFLSLKLASNLKNKSKKDVRGIGAALAGFGKAKYSNKLI
tara:strand:- start:48 stop:293 length:246 start_codon:yes stop_codon:yes gene_type:complete